VSKQGTLSTSMLAPVSVLLS